MIVALAALVTALALASLAVSLYALYRAHRLSHAARINAIAVREDCAAIIEAAKTQFASTATELQAVRSHASPEILPGMPKAGMNLTRRSHALRMHRTGKSPEEIAAALEVPRQEVALLLRVHEIVLNRI